jgi:hypothetical protein
MAVWNSRRILKEICDAGRRRAVLTAFWKDAEPDTRHAALARLARNLHFREETLRKAPVEKKAELLAAQIGAAEFEEPLEVALMAYHTGQARDLLAAFLDFWKIPHVNGSIEEEHYRPPSPGDVERAVEALQDRFDMRDILLYLATAGLLMGGSVPAWRESTWPLVDRQLAGLSGALSHPNGDRL